jgi:glycosyltransferase involved in cell wall biosynthesis
VRVLFVTPAFAPAWRYGGPIRSLDGLVRALRKAGVDVRVLTTDADGPETLNVPAGWTEWQGTPVRYERRWFAPDLAPAFAWRALAEARDAELVHVTGVFSVPSMIALVAAQAMRRPVVLSPRGALEGHALRVTSQRTKRLWLRAFEPLLERVTLFHATSDQEADSIRRAFPNSNVSVVPNGFDGDAMSEALTTPSRTDLVVGALGRIDPIKALENLVLAIVELRSRGVACGLQIAGPIQDRAYRARLSNLIRQHGMDPASVFLGELRDAPKWKFLAGCRVIALPSASENFGNVVIEALAAGTPVVASTGTPWQVLEDAGAGRWVANDASSLADALEPYLRDETVASRAGAAGRALVHDRYGWDRIAAAMCAVYAGILDRRPAR